MKYLKSKNHFKDTNNNIFIKYNNNFIPIGSEEYTNLVKKYPIINGTFQTDQSIAEKTAEKKWNKNILKDHVMNFNPDNLPQYNKKSKNSQKVYNPFTQVPISTNSLIYKDLLILYKNVNGVLKPRQKPTKILNSTTGRLILPKSADLLIKKDKSLLMAGYTIIKTRKDIVKTLFNNNLKYIELLLNDGTSVEDQKYIIDSIMSSLVNEKALDTDYHMTFTLRLNIQGTHNKYHNDIHLLTEIYEKNPTTLKQNIIEALLQKQSGFNFPGEDYVGEIYGIKILLVKPITSGGCQTGGNKVVIFEDEPDIVYKSWKSKDNYCFESVLARNCNQIHRNTLPKSFITIRKQLGFAKPKDMIDIQHVIDNHQKISDYFQINIYLSHFGNTYSWGSKIGYTDVYIALRNNHYYSYHRKNVTNTKQSSQAFLHNKYRQKNEPKAIQPSTKSYTRLAPFDKSIMIHMAVEMDELHIIKFGWLHGSDWIDTNKIEDFIDFCTKLVKIDDKNYICHCYNGSSEFFYLILNHLKNNNIPFSNVLSVHGNLVKFSFLEKKITFFDLIGFISSPLETLALENNLEYNRNNLQHTTHITRQIFDIYCAKFYMAFQIYITDFITLPQLSSKLWKSYDFSYLDELIILPKIHDEAPFIFSSIYGPRTFPLINTLPSGLSLIYLDAYSLYPSVMGLPKYKYPVGPSRWLQNNEINQLNHLLSKNPENTFNLLGFYEIHFLTPKNIRVPILPQTDQKNGLIHSLIDGSGVYCSVDILEAIKYGYQITKITKALVWDKSDCVFKNFISKIINLKENSKDNKTDYRIAKILLNSLYGKMLQKNKYNRTKTCLELNDIHNFIENNNINTFQLVNDDFLIVSGSIKSHLIDEIKAPIHLGSFILAYTRQLMNTFMAVADPSLKTAMFYYTDTDSLFVTPEIYKKLEKAGYIIDQNDTGSHKLSKLKNDLGDGALIIEAIFLGPKKYYYKYKNKNGTISTKIVVSGLPKIIKKQYENEIIEKFFKNREDFHYSFETINKSINHGLTKRTIHKTLTHTLWNKMNFDHSLGQWFPIGYQSH